MASVTVTVKRAVGLVAPPSVRRQAGIKAGDQLEFQACLGVITIMAKSQISEDGSAAQRRMIDREIAKGLEDVRNGGVHGPFTAPEGGKFFQAEFKYPR